MHRRPPPQRAQRRRRAVAPPPRLSPLKSVARARICIGVWCGIETEQLVSYLDLLQMASPKELLGGAKAASCLERLGLLCF